MDDQEQTSCKFEIDNFSEKEGVIPSPKFLSGGCEWYVCVYPKGDNIEDHLALNLYVANRESLRLGWKRRATFSFLLLNQSGKELYRTDVLRCKLFCAQVPGWGLPRTLVSVSRLFTKHPDFATNFKPKNKLVKTTYMNILLGLIEALNKPPQSLSDIELSNARRELIELTEAGFKLAWLKTKLDELSLERKKANDDDVSRVQATEQVKNLNFELDTEKVKSATCAAKVLSLEQKVSDLRAELSKEKAKSTTSKDDVLEGVIHSWELLDYADLL
ncbi:unnamed protein product [Thlaspi arvense]|uniref:MATH domain-containing protein n=1 Tax=Thlaspi arvense TaxID=13288 RepID=A0AAU9RTX6_THLAR|nr:unnamed protein product [Thlaspi arvense]